MIKKTDQTKKGVELMIPGIVIGVIVLVIVIWLISSYNGFVTLRNKTEEAFSAIDVSCKCQYKNDQKVENKNVHFPRSIPQFVFP